VKLAELAGAAIAFVAIKRLTDTKPTAVTATPAAKPLIKNGFVTGPAATGQDFSVLPTSLTAFTGKPSIDPLLPTEPVKQPGADFKPLFPETAVTAGKEFAYNAFNRTTD
jgi:hypothetical protein